VGGPLQGDLSRRGSDPRVDDTFPALRPPPDPMQPFVAGTQERSCVRVRGVDRL